jgi:glycosyltransferase involved in cell wall biosynthesis
MARSITYLLDRVAPGETFIAREIEALRRLGWTVDVIALDTLDTRRPSGGAANVAAHGLLRRAGAELMRNPVLAARLLRHLPHARALAERLAAGGARQLHAHFAWLPADLAGVAAAACGIPWTCSVHAWDVFTRPPSETNRRLRSAAGIAACTQAGFDALLRAGLPPARIHLIRHGQPLAPAPPPADHTARDNRLLAVGRLVPKKGFDTLVAACRLLSDRGVAYTCHMIGDGPERAALEHAIHRADLATRVCMESAQPHAQVLARIAAATLLVLPSRRLRDGDRDGFANVLAEAMACGTPVVTTAAGAAGELITDGHNGQLVSPDDPCELADTLAMLLSDAAARARLAAAARQTVTYDLNEMTEVGKLIGLFEATRGEG